MKKHRVLGLTIDDELKWQSHVGSVCKTVSNNVFLMSQLKRYVSFQILIIFFNSHIMPHINFSSTVWDGYSEIHLSKLNSLHRRSAKLLNPDKNLTKDEKQKSLSILPLQRQLDFNKALLMFKANRSMVPSYITSLFSECNNRTIQYIVPKPRIDLYNALPVGIKTVGTIRRFKSELHKHLMTD